MPVNASHWSETPCSTQHAFEGKWTADCVQMEVCNETLKEVQEIFVQVNSMGVEVILTPLRIAWES